MLLFSLHCSVLSSQFTVHTRRQERVRQQISSGASLGNALTPSDIMANEVESRHSILHTAMAHAPISSLDRPFQILVHQYSQRPSVRKPAFVGEELPANHQNRVGPVAIGPLTLIVSITRGWWEIRSIIKSLSRECPTIIVSGPINVSNALRIPCKSKIALSSEVMPENLGRGMNLDQLQGRTRKYRPCIPISVGGLSHHRPNHQLNLGPTGPPRQHLAAPARRKPMCHYHLLWIHALR